MSTLRLHPRPSKRFRQAREGFLANKLTFSVHHAHPFLHLNQEITVKELFEVVADVGKASVLNDSVNANDLHRNKKRFAVKLAKAAAWTLIHVYTLFIVIKYCPFVVAIFLVVTLLSTLYFLS